MKNKYNLSLSSLPKLLKIEHNWFHIKRHFFTMITHLTFRKLVNLLYVELQRRLKIPVIKGFPPFLKIEPTNFCNLKCPNCYTGSGADNRKKGMMDLELYKRLIDEVGDYVIRINLFFWGEPFLCPHLIEMISYASKKNIGTCVSTNFLIFSEEKADEILRSGLDYLIICFDGVDKKTYEAYRKGGQLEVLFNNMKILSEARKAAKLSSPFIDVQFIVFDYNKDQIDKARELVKPFGFDRFTIKMDAEQKEPYNPDIFKSNIPCYWLYLVSTIGWDGSVTPCCDMPPTNFGNLNNHTFREIWNGEQYVKARKLYKYDNPTKSKSMCAFCHRGPNEQYKQEIMKGGYKGNQRLLFLQKEKPWDASKD